MKTMLFTTTRCPKCPAAKQYLKQKQIEYTEMIADKELEAMTLAETYGIQQVPTIVELENDKPHIYSLTEYKATH